jgi:hypothetical protein
MLNIHLKQMNKTSVLKCRSWILFEVCNFARTYWVIHRLLTKYLCVVWCTQRFFLRYCSDWLCYVIGDRNRLHGLTRAWMMIYEAVIVHFTEETDRWVSSSKSNVYPFVSLAVTRHFLRLYRRMILVLTRVRQLKVLYFIIRYEFKYERSFCNFVA